MSPGKKTPFPNPDRRPDLRRGMHACLANNIWGTNYVMWQPYGPEGRDMRFRFVLQVSHRVVLHWCTWDSVATLRDASQSQGTVLTYDYRVRLAKADCNLCIWGHCSVTAV